MIDYFVLVFVIYIVERVGPRSPSTQPLSVEVDTVGRRRHECGPTLTDSHTVLKQVPGREIDGREQGRIKRSDQDVGKV